MRIEIEISDENIALIEEFTVDNQSDEYSTHGPLDLTVLARMLMEDVALAVKRPGSWEGFNMIRVLESHGYKI